MHRILFLLLTLISLQFLGCDGRPSRVRISGTVFVDGEPLNRAGFVQVVPSDGRASTGKINPADGTFTLSCYEKGDGCLLGEHKVAVICNVARGDSTVWLIDSKYSDTENSGLTVNIEEPTKDLKIELSGGVKNIRAKPTEFE